MPKHRYDLKRAWWQQRRHLLHRLHTAQRWLKEQLTDLQDILAELKKKN